MCWISIARPVRKTAKTDIAVFKIFRCHNNSIESPFYLNKWEINEVAVTTLGIPIKGVCTWNVDKGFHSIKMKPYKKSFYGRTSWFIGDIKLFTCLFGETVLKCVIPKGSHYYENEHGEIVSDELKIVDSPPISYTRIINYIIKLWNRLIKMK